MEGAIYPNVVVPEEFRALYRERYRDQVQVSFAYNAYVVAKMILGIKRSTTAPLAADLVNTEMSKII